MSKRYQIELSEEQLILISHAVEDWHRFLAGQCDLHHAVSCSYTNGERMHKLDEILSREVHPLVTPELPLNASYGWSGGSCPNKEQKRTIAMSYGIYREILHFLAINIKERTGWSCYESETLTCEDTGGLIKIKEIADAPTFPDFDTEVYNWLRKHGSDETRQLIEMTARHFWEMAQNCGAMLHVADKSYKMGRRDERMEMMKDAVEGIVIDEDMFGNKICVAKIPKDSSFKKRGLVKVIILKEEDEQ